MSYETHITLFPGDGARAVSAVDSDVWKSSKIDGDPVLGDGVHFYLTSHSSTPELSFRRMRTAQTRLRDAGIEIRRMKIEHIIYDTKTSVGLDVTERNIGWEYS